MIDGVGQVIRRLLQRALFVSEPVRESRVRRIELDAARAGVRQASARLCETARILEKTAAEAADEVRRGF